MDIALLLPLTLGLVEPLKLRQDLMDVISKPIELLKFDISVEAAPAAAGESGTRLRVTFESIARCGNTRTPRMDNKYLVLPSDREMTSKEGLMGFVVENLVVLLRIYALPHPAASAFYVVQ